MDGPVRWSDLGDRVPAGTCGICHEPIAADEVIICVVDEGSSVGYAVHLECSERREMWERRNETNERIKRNAFRS